MSEPDAYAALHGAIVSGELSPGERLIEEELAEQLGLSRGAVRNAILRLGHEGLVVRERNRGARVRRFSPEEAIEILEARAALESLAAGYAALRRTKDEARELQSLVKDMEKLLRAGELLAMSERNAVLHRRILEISAPPGRARHLLAPALPGRPLPVPHRARARPLAEVARRASEARHRDRPRATARPPSRRCASTSRTSRPRSPTSPTPPRSHALNYVLTAMRASAGADWS